MPVAYKYLSAVFAAAIAVRLFQHLKEGYVEWGEKAISGDRSKDPFSYWFIISIEICLLFMMTLCAFVIDG
jgi:hypothetical protein